MECRRYSVLGVVVDALTMPLLGDVLKQTIESGGRKLFANHNLHSIYVYNHDAKMRAFYDAADHIIIDGMPIIVAGRLLGHPLKVENRVSFLDWLPLLFEKAAQENWRLFYLGSAPGIAEKGQKLLQNKIANLHMVVAHGFFDPTVGEAENSAVLAQINAFKPHILFVGMGMPREEHWILDNLQHISANVILVAGGTMDYIAGVVPTPPRWLGPLCLEWLFRLASEPRRLWRRYLVEPWFILKIFFAEFFRRRE
jgi:N-acetylglucosaminyldiphosphoundecaprenol N-acetyl-beta-D-mannosaminyltransferase